MVSQRVEAWRSNFRAINQKTAPALLRRSDGDQTALIRWQAFLRGCSRFVADRDGVCMAEDAVAASWDEYELFGCDRTAPMRRYNRMGALWFAHGIDIVEVTERAIWYKNGLAFRRSEDLDPRFLLLPWEIE
jgi:hypothetical protein